VPYTITLPHAERRKTLGGMLTREPYGTRLAYRPDHAQCLRMAWVTGQETR
jgi:hypothetical protein